MLALRLRGLSAVARPQMCALSFKSRRSKHLQPLVPQQEQAIEQTFRRRRRREVEFDGWVARVLADAGSPINIRLFSGLAGTQAAFWTW